LLRDGVVGLCGWTSTMPCKRCSSNAIGWTKHWQRSTRIELCSAAEQLEGRLENGDVSEDVSERAIVERIENVVSMGATLVDLGKTHEQLGEIDAAQSAYESALALEPQVGGAKEAIDRLTAN